MQNWFIAYLAYNFPLLFCLFVWNYGKKLTPVTHDVWTQAQGLIDIRLLIPTYVLSLYGLQSQLVHEYRGESLVTLELVFNHDPPCKKQEWRTMNLATSGSCPFPLICGLNLTSECSLKILEKSNLFWGSWGLISFSKVKEDQLAWE